MKTKYLRTITIVSALFISGIILFSACTKSISESKVSSKELTSPKTIQVDLTKYAAAVYITTEGDDTIGNGSKQAPYATIQKGVSAQTMDGLTAVLVARGEYSENNIQLKNGVSLFGGFNSTDWSRDIVKHETIVSGKGEGRIIVAADNLTIDGFTFTDGKLRGQGGAIYCRSVSPTISNNVFKGNVTLKPIPWNPKYWHETANDGGAIYCEKNSNPVIENNIFVKNQTENGRGGAIACNDNCKPVIRNNVFYKNTTGLDDPMRSSDGAAISIFNRCNAEITGNVILSNTALARNDAGGVFVALWSSAKIENNLFVDNESGDDAGALFVGGQEHRYDAPLDPIPPKDKFFVSIKNNKFLGNRNSSRNSGAMRFTMESRGEFVHNIVVQNNGVYFQRSEVLVADNTILDNFLFIETKEGLELGTIENNVIWSEYTREVDATVRNNNMKYPEEGNGNYSDQVSFVNDDIEINVLSANWTKTGNKTNVLTDKKFETNSLINRVVRIGDDWNVIISNDSDSFTIYGNYSAIGKVYILPTYTLDKK